MRNAFHWWLTVRPSRFFRALVVVILACLIAAALRWPIIALLAIVILTVVPPGWDPAVAIKDWQEPK
jgi:hypothetical protein